MQDIKIFIECPHHIFIVFKHIFIVAFGSPSFIFIDKDSVIKS